MKVGSIVAGCLAALTGGGAAHAGSLPRLTPNVFDVAFRGGTFALPDGKALKFESEAIGKLKCPSGKIGAIEPFAVRKLNPFTVSVPPGDYPVFVALTEYVPNHPRVAFAKITFGDELPVYWQLAIPQDFDISRLKPGLVVGYPVDGGIGSFMDEQTAMYLATLDEGEGFNAELEKTFNERPIKRILMAGSGNVAVFSTGIGDGRYPSYFGFTAAGKPVALITDFGMVPWK